MLSDEVSETPNSEIYAASDLIQRRASYRKETRTSWRSLAEMRDLGYTITHDPHRPTHSRLVHTRALANGIYIPAF